MSRREHRGYLARLERRRRLLHERRRRQVAPQARQRKVGLPPGTVVHTGTRYMDQATLDLISYSEGELIEEAGVTLTRALAARHEARAAGRTLWLDVTGLHDTELIEALGRELGLHPLTLEDIASVGQRPKLESYDAYLFVVVRMLSLGGNEADDERGAGRDGHVRLDNEQLSMILADGMLITFQERPGDVFQPVRQRLRASKGRIRKLGADYLTYALLDVLIDTCFGVLERYGDDAELLEQAVFEDPRPPLLHELQRLRRDALELRRAVWPLRDLLSALIRDEDTLVSDTVRTYLRDVLDHAVQAIDAVETLRELLAGLHDGYLSGLSQRMNEVMKVLTVIATIFIPLSFLVGVYGMNFVWMPELAWRWSYPLLWLLMLTIVATMLAYFRRRGWL